MGDLCVDLDVSCFGTYLKLVDMGRPYLTHTPQLLNMPNTEVADPDRAGLALLVQSLQCEPQVPALLGPATRRVNQEQVDVALACC